MEKGTAFLESCGGRVPFGLFKAMSAAMDSCARERLENRLEQACPQVFAALSDGRFEFDELENVSIEDMVRILAQCDNHDVFLALKGSSPVLRAKVFSALEPESAMQLRIKLDTAGPVPLAEVEAAQKRIELKAAKLLST